MPSDSPTMGVLTSEFFVIDDVSGPNASTAAASTGACAASVCCESQPSAGTNLWLTPGFLQMKETQEHAGWQLGAGDLPKSVF